MGVANLCVVVDGLSNVRIFPGSATDAKICKTLKPEEKFLGNNW